VSTWASLEQSIEECENRLLWVPIANGIEGDEHWTWSMNLKYDLLSKEMWSSYVD
jgi:hypothetical protein